MDSQHTETDAAFADMLAALGSATRLQLFRLLVRAGPEGRSVGAIKQAMGIPASTLAHHLGALVQAGLVEQTKVGRQVRSAVRYGATEALVAYLTEACCADSDASTDHAHLLQQFGSQKPAKELAS